MNHEQIGKKRSRFKETWRRLKKSRNAMIGLALITIIIVAALIGAFVLAKYFDGVYGAPARAEQCD